MQGLRGPLTLITAPAGFGKTTLLASAIAGCRMPVAWLSLDKDDDHPGRFLNYLIAALQVIDNTIGSETAQLAAASQPVPPETILIGLINNLDTTGKEIALVLDDYQFICNKAVHEEVSFLLEHCPCKFHIVIATRSDPPLPLTRFRASGQMVELRASDLRFTMDEATQFLSEVMGLHLDTKLVMVLEERTEGWIAGLQMAALSMRDSKDVEGFIEGFSGTNRYIMDYLLEEVLASQPSEIQRFLLYTSILARLTAPLCDAVVANHLGLKSQSSSILEYLERANLFLAPLDDERKWYRYHHLFADLLRIRLVQSHGDKHLRILHGRAAKWYEESLLSAEAIEHALAANKPDLAACVIERSAADAWMGGEFYQVLRWIEALPKELVRSHPWLCVWYAWSRLQAGKVDGVDELIDDAERATGPYPCPSSGSGPVQDGALAEQFAALRVTWASLRHETHKTIELARLALEQPMTSNQAASFMARTNVLNVLGFAYYLNGDLVQAEQVYCEARKVARESNFVLREILVVHKLAHIYQDLGCLGESYRLCQEALAQLQDHGRQVFFAAGYLYCDLGHLLIMWNRLDEAEQMIAQSTRLNELAQVPQLTVDTCNTRARLFLAQGDLDAAQTALKQADELIQKYYCWPEVVSANQCYQVRLWLARGDVQKAARWVEQCQSANSGQLDFLSEMDEIAKARVLLAQGLPDKALRLLNVLASAAEAGGRTGRLIEILALQALSLSLLRDGEQSQNTTQPVLELLEKCLQLGKTEGFVRLYVDEELSMAALLQQAIARGIEPDFVQKLLDAFAKQEDKEQAPVTESRRPSSTFGVPSRLVEPLSERELEVLHLVAMGRTNKEIARQLIVSPGTVKAHTASIYRKLDVANRTEAAARARDLGLLS
jgi:LuxR family maltose regulon positive regulatory protein